jgi:hypothetical protein
MPRDELHALIGVIRKGDKTLYVKRSQLMENYPGVWSLLSGRADRHEVSDSLDLTAIQKCVDRLSTERLQGTPLAVKRFLTSAQCDKYDHRLFLYMYEIQCDGIPRLNPRYYDDARFMTVDEYLAASHDSMCGLCMSMWSRYCVRNGLADRPFAEVHDLEPEGELYA